MHVPRSTARSVSTVAVPAVVVAAVAVLGLAACQSQQSGVAEAASSSAAGTSKSAAPERPSTTGGVPKCVAADVSGVFSAPEAALGVQGVRVIVTNTGKRTCTIFGYGGVEMFSGGDGRPIGIVLARVPQPGPTVVTLKPGQKANKSLTWQAPSGPTGDPAQCSPFVGSAGVILPDDTQSITVTGDLGQVCNNRMVDGRAFSAGGGTG